MVSTKYFDHLYKKYLSKKLFSLLELFVLRLLVLILLVIGIQSFSILGIGYEIAISNNQFQIGDNEAYNLIILNEGNIPIEMEVQLSDNSTKSIFVQNNTKINVEIYDVKQLETNFKYFLKFEIGNQSNIINSAKFLAFHGDIFLFPNKYENESQVDENLEYLFTSFNYTRDGDNIIAKYGNKIAWIQNWKTGWLEYYKDDSAGIVIIQHGFQITKPVTTGFSFYTSITLILVVFITMRIKKKRLE